MYLCYIDESGTPNIPGNSPHFVLAGIALPIWHWQTADKQLSQLMKQYDLDGQELHAGWLLRHYHQQQQIKDFEKMTRDERGHAVRSLRAPKNLDRQARKNQKKQAPYMHLTPAERQNLIRDAADIVGEWGFARLFAECIDKSYFKSRYHPGPDSSVQYQAFEQVISRFEQFLEKAPEETDSRTRYGLIVHDNNQTIEKRTAEVMRRFHQEGTPWTDIKHIIETPLFVDSSLTSMVQMADLCAYALRRYLEKQETDLFRRIFPRAHRLGPYAVGVRHFTGRSCRCEICLSHSS